MSEQGSVPEPPVAGFYWIERGHGPEVAQFNGRDWLAIGDEVELTRGTVTVLSPILKPPAQIITLPGSTTHDWRRCACGSCVSYRDFRRNHKDD